MNVKPSNRIVGRADYTLESSLGRDYAKEKRELTEARQKRALHDFFRDTGGKITDIRVLRSAMYLSDEIDRAVRGVDVENQFIGWRQYNRFYAEGTEDLFVNIPTGRSPLVLAAPKIPEGTIFAPIEDTAPSIIEYQSNRRSLLKQMGRTLGEIEQTQLDSLQEKPSSEQEHDFSFNKTEYSPKVNFVVPDRKSSVSLTQPFNVQNPKEIKSNILKFEGEITDRRPDQSNQ